MNTENKTVGNSTISHTLEASPPNTSIYKRIKIIFSKKQKSDTKSTYIKTIDIGTPEIQSTTNKNLHNIPDITPAKKLDIVTNIQNHNNNDN
jgi:tRNA-binding EMAP/Myf-like protein